MHSASCTSILPFLALSTSTLPLLFSAFSPALCCPRNSSRKSTTTEQQERQQRAAKQATKSIIANKRQSKLYWRLPRRLPRLPLPSFLPPSPAASTLSSHKILAYQSVACSLAPSIVGTFSASVPRCGAIKFNLFVSNNFPWQLFVQWPPYCARIWPQPGQMPANGCIN